MKYRPLGHTGLFVSELCLGTMIFGGSEDGSIQSKIGQLRQEESERIVGSSLDAGIDFIDTAEIYAGGRSDEITGQALRNLKVPRESVVVATRVRTPARNVPAKSCALRHMKFSIEESAR